MKINGKCGVKNVAILYMRRGFNTQQKLAIGFIFIIFSITSWDAFELLVQLVLKHFGADTEINRLLVYIVFAAITLYIIAKTSSLDLLADPPKDESESPWWSKTKQILIGLAFIILWIAVWDSFEIISDMLFARYGGDTDINRLVYYVIITAITLFIIVQQGQLDLLDWST